jgi:hypothetical protein
MDASPRTHMSRPLHKKKHSFARVSPPRSLPSLVSSNEVVEQIEEDTTTSLSSSMSPEPSLSSRASVAASDIGIEPPAAAVLGEGGRGSGNEPLAAAERREGGGGVGGRGPRGPFEMAGVG